MLDLSKERIFITGAHGFLGQHFVKKLQEIGATNLVTPTHREADFKDRNICDYFMQDCSVCVHLAAYVGGIGLNRKDPVGLFYENMVMGLNLISSAATYNIKKFLMPGTVCSYPKFAPTPFKESDLWNGYPEETNAPYGVAKKALLVYMQSMRAQFGLNGIMVLPTNLYGPNDDFDPENSHVIPALIRKIHKAKNELKSSVELWGTGTATRDFLYVEDCANGLLKALQLYNGSMPINLGSGKETSIMDLASMISRILGFDGDIVFNTSMPDGQPSRKLDTSMASNIFGFNSETSLASGLVQTIGWYLKEYK